MFFFVFQISSKLQDSEPNQARKCVSWSEMCQLIHEYELHFLVGEKAGAQVAEKPIPISQGGDLEDVLRKDFFYLF